MDKEFVTYEQAVALNELKYDGDYNYTYTIDKHLWYGDVKADGVSTLAAPLKQQVFRWFREKYNLWSFIHPEVYSKEWNYHVQEWSKTEHWGELWQGDSWDTYKEAENACIDKLLEIAKQQ